MTRREWAPRECVVTGAPSEECAVTVREHAPRVCCN